MRGIKGIVAILIALIITGCVKPGDSSFQTGMAAYGKKDYTAAKAAFEDALKEESNYSHMIIYSMLANVHLALKEEDEAIECYNLALSEKEDYRTIVMLGSLYHKLERDAEAVSSYERAIALDPSAPEAYAAWGALELGRDNGNKARELLERARDINPRLAVTRANLAIALALAGERDKAVAEMAEARNLKCEGIENFQGRLDEILEGTGQ